MYGTPDGLLSHTGELIAHVIGVQDGRMAFHRNAAGREIRPRHNFDQLGRRRLGPIQQQQAGVDQFADIVRRNGRRHAHGDAG